MMRSFSQSIILTGGTVVNSLLGLVFYIWIGRELSVEAFGYFSFLFVIGVLLNDIFDMGFGQAIIKFGHGEDFRNIFSLTVLQRVVVEIILIGLALVAQLFYPANLLLSALVACASLLLYLILQSFLAKQQYLLYVMTNVVGNISRLGIIFLFVTVNILSAETALGAVIIANSVAFVLGLALLSLITRSLPFVFSKVGEELRKVFGFSAWMGLSFAVSALVGKIDGPLVFALAGSQSAGLYASAQRLNSVLLQIAGSLDGVFSPKIAKGENFSKFFKEYLVLALTLGAALLLALPFTSLALTLLFGAKYDGAAPLLQVLLLGMIAFFITGPFSASVVYRFGKSKLHFLNSLVQLGVVIVSLSLLVPPFGAMGAALSFLIVQLTNLVFFTASYLVCRSLWSKSQPTP